MGGVIDSPAQQRCDAAAMLRRQGLVVPPCELREPHTCRDVLVRDESGQVFRTDLILTHPRLDGVMVEPTPKPRGEPAPLCVAICVPIYDNPKTRFWRAYAMLQKPSSGSAAFNHRGATRCLDTHGYTIVEARNLLTDNALRSGKPNAPLDPQVTHVLFIDDDMEFPPDALKRLLDHDVPIVGGLCHSRRPPYHPILGRKHPEGRIGYGWCYHYPPNSLFEVDVTGGAFLLIKREVFERISDDCGPGVWWSQQNGRSEDFSFCERARAAGFKILVDTGLEIGHVAELVITSEVAKKLRTYHWDSWIPDPGVHPGSPIASIVIPTYNQKPKWLRAAILSASHQTVPVEVIVVDDGSDTPVPTEDWPENVRIYRLPRNRGISAALNTGIKAMTTRWFSWLSSDDLIDPRKIELQLEALHQSGGRASFHRWQAITEEGGFSTIADLPGWKTIDEQQRTLAQVCAINGSTVMIERTVFEDVGLFDEDFRYGQDYEMWCRIGSKFFWYPLEEILGTRREVPSNLTSTIANAAPDDPRKLRRDAEDASIRARYRWPR